MKYWYTWPPKITNVLKTTNDQLFHEIAKNFTLIMGTEVAVSIQKYEDSWRISYQINDGRSLKFNFSLYDPANKVYLYSGFEIAEPAIDIHELLIQPQGQGLGTRIMFAFLEKIETTPFTRIVLRAGNQDEAKFWERFGFQYKTGTSPYLPGMYMDLSPRPRKQKKPIIRIHYST